MREAKFEALLFDYIRDNDYPNLDKKNVSEIMWIKNLERFLITKSGGWVYVDMKYYPNGEKGLEISSTDWKLMDVYLFYHFTDIIADVLCKRRMNKLNDLIGD